MKAIIRIFYTEPTIVLLTANAVVTALAAEGVISAWIAVVTLAATAPLLRELVSPARK